MESKFTYRLIKHSEISSDLIELICSLKKKRWNYSIESHKKWMLDNIQNDDYHLIVYENSIPVAYMNLVEIEVIINGNVHNFKGIGNVCTVETGKGYGNILMLMCNEVIINNNWKGVLICKNHLIAYYNKFGWDLIDCNKIVSKALESTYFMYFNVESDIEKFDYSGRNF